MYYVFLWKGVWRKALRIAVDSWTQTVRTAGSDGLDSGNVYVTQSGGT